jgi:ATP-dependent exoDNAse (exonuclease V) alpha subunit
VRALGVDHRPVVGLAPTATAAQVLADETGMVADTIDRFLLDDHQSARSRWPVGTTVIVDEAGMVATSKLAERGWAVRAR